MSDAELRTELARLLDAYDAANRGYDYDGYPKGSRTVYVQDVRLAEGDLGRFVVKHGRQLLGMLA